MSGIPPTSSFSSWAVTPSWFVSAPSTSWLIVAWFCCNVRVCTDVYVTPGSDIVVAYFNIPVALILLYVFTCIVRCGCIHLGTRAVYTRCNRFQFRPAPAWCTIGNKIPNCNVQSCSSNSLERWDSTTCSCEPLQSRLAELKSLNSLTSLGCQSLRAMWKESTCQQTCRRI